MKKVFIIFSLICFASFYVNGQVEKVEPTSQTAISLGNLAFTIYPNPTDSEFKIEFLLPRDQSMEMYLIDLSGDMVKELLPEQTLEAGVRAFDFTFPDSATKGIYFIVIKSHGKSLIKKLEYQGNI